MVATGFAALFWTTTVGALVALPFAPQIGDLLSGDALDPDLVRIAIGGLWVLTLYEYMVTLFRLDERAKAYFAFTIGNVLLAIPLTVAARGRLRRGRRGPAARQLPRRPAVPAAADLRRALAASSLRPDRDLLRRMLRFGLPTMPAEMSIYSLAFIDRIIIVRSIGLAELGLYGLAFKFSQAIQVVVRGFQLAWPPLAYSIRDDEEARRAYAVVVTAFTASAASSSSACGCRRAGSSGCSPTPASSTPTRRSARSRLGAALYGVYLALVVILGRTGRTGLQLPGRRSWRRSPT